MSAWKMAVLSCDSEDCDEEFTVPCPHVPATRKAAARAGWTADRAGNVDYCPEHSSDERT